MTDDSVLSPSAEVNPARDDLSGPLLFWFVRDCLPSVWQEGRISLMVFRWFWSLVARVSRLSPPDTQRLLLLQHVSLQPKPALCSSFTQVAHVPDSFAEKGKKINISVNGKPHSLEIFDVYWDTGMNTGIVHLVWPNESDYDFLTHIRKDKAWREQTEYRVVGGVATAGQD